MGYTKYIKNLYYGFINGIKNCIRWFPVIWCDIDWDYTALMILMETKLRQMSKYFKDHGNHTRSEVDVKQTLLCAELLKRLQNDNYAENAGYNQDTYHLLSEYQKKNIWEHSHKMSQQDLKLLGYMIGKYLRNWWD